VQQQEVVDLTAQPGFVQNPYPLYARFREAGPPRRVVLHGLSAWLVTRYEDVRQALVHPRLSSDPRNASEAARAVTWAVPAEVMGMGRMMLTSDPPDHDRLRRLVARVFTPGRVEAMRPRVQQIADELLAGFSTRGRADLMDEFALPLPMMVIMELLGLPAEDRQGFRRMASGSGSTDPATVAAAGVLMRGYFVQNIERKRADLESAGRDDLEAADLLTALIAVHDEGERLNQEELLAMTLLLLSAGFETTINLIGNGMLALLRSPDQMALLRADPGLITRAIEEFLRYDGAVEMVLPRFSTGEVSLGDVVIPGGGEPVLLCLAGADRDPARFPGADHLDVRRDTTGHVAFGHGIHFCLGAPLARLEGQIAFRTLLEGCADLALAVDPVELTWRPTMFTRGVAHLPVTFTPP